MIFHKRGEPDILFQTDIIRDLEYQEHDFYELGDDQTKQSKSRVIEENQSIEMDISQLLDKEFKRKCVFCEQNIDGKNIIGVNHRYRPRRNTVQGKETFKKHYYWYTYKWDNLFLTCFQCNGFKGNQFPIFSTNRGNSAVSIDIIDGLELPGIINPCKRNPEEILSYSSDGLIFGAEDSAKLTIEILHLNRPILITKRKEIYKLYKDKSREFIENDVLHSDDFIGLRRYIANTTNKTEPLKNIESKPPTRRSTISFSKADDALGAAPVGYADPKSENPRNLEKLIDQSEFQFLQLQSIEIKNFKNITNLTFNFPSPSTENKNASASWTFLLGENGSGKSSILQAITFALIGNVHTTPILEYLEPGGNPFLQYGAQKGSVKLVTSDGTFIVTLFPDRIEGEKIPAKALVLAYGSTRLMSTYKGIDNQKYGLPIRANNLFIPTYGLLDAKEWLLDLTEPSFDLVAIVLKDVLNLTESTLNKDEEGLITRREKDIFFKSKNYEVPQQLSSLSDGYKTIIALVCDICKTIDTVVDNTQRDYADINGIVILDEIGTHLHPRWKMRIVGALRKAFSKIQFIVSSHEPLCLRNLHEGEVIVVEYGPVDGEDRKDVTLLQDLPDPSRYRIDQILTSPFFGLYSAIDPSEENDFAQYYELLRKGDKLDKKEQKDLERLSIKIRDYSVMGKSFREELAFFAVDSILAERQSKQQASWKSIKEDVKSKVEELWSKYDQ